MPRLLPCGVTLHAEVGLPSVASGYALWGVAAWGSGVWGPGETWVDIAPWVRRLEVDRGFSRELAAWRSGTALVVLDDRDGRWSPTNLSGPYAAGGVTSIRPWRPIRISAEYGGAVYPIYAGWVLDWLQDWPDGHDAIVTLPCADEWSRLARAPHLAVAPVGAGESSGARCHRVLDAAGHAGPRDIDPGMVTVQATDLGHEPTVELQLTADSEGGAAYVNASGVVVCRDRYSLIEDARSIEVQAVYGDGIGPVTEIPCQVMPPATGSDRVVSRVEYARVGGVTQVQSSPISQALYGHAVDARADLVCETDGQVAGLAEWKILRDAEPRPRFEAITIQAGGRTAEAAARIWPAVLGREVRDLVRCVRRPPAGDAITRLAHVSRLKHSTDGESWLVTLGLESAEPYATYAASRWDIGAWDAAVWFV